MNYINGKLVIYYILDITGMKPIPEPDFLRWARWMEKIDNRIVKQEFIGKVKISTVFLGSDHGFGRESQPVLWETMIFNGAHSGYQERYTSWIDALKGHRAAVALVNKENIGLWERFKWSAIRLLMYVQKRI